MGREDTHLLQAIAIKVIMLDLRVLASFAVVVGRYQAQLTRRLVNVVVGVNGCFPAGKAIQLFTLFAVKFDVLAWVQGWLHGAHKEHQFPLLATGPCMQQAYKNDKQ